jgi:hypothetical protein
MILSYVFAKGITADMELAIKTKELEAEGYKLELIIARDDFEKKKLILLGTIKDLRNQLDKKKKS